MYHVDPKLIVMGIQAHHQDKIQQAQQAKFTREAKTVNSPRKIVTPLRTALASVINLVMRLG